MLETERVGRHSVYVCTNISCSLRGADELYGAFEQATAGDADFNLRAFECLGACDIAPMASVDGVYVGPLSPDDVPELLDDVRGGRPVLPDKQLRIRPAADPEANEEGIKGAAAPGDGAREEDEPHRAVPGAATPDIAPERAAFGPPMEGDAAGPPAAIEQSPQEKTGDGGEASGDAGEASDDAGEASGDAGEASGDGSEGDGP